MAPRRACPTWESRMLGVSCVARPGWNKKMEDYGAPRKQGEVIERMERIKLQ